MKKYLFTLILATIVFSAQAKTLVVYYSYTNNVNRIITELTKQIEADVIRVEPSEKGLDYAADNYAIGSAQISAIRNNPDKASSYPAIDPVKVNAVEVGAISLQTEPGVLTMYAVANKDNPCNITILETYSSQEAYRKHIASSHFQKYKHGTLHMVKSLVLDDVTPLNPYNQITNFIIDK